MTSGNPWSSEHIRWLIDTGKRLKTADGKDVEVWEFRHEKDDAVLSAWAKHYRNHYCSDNQIEHLCQGTGKSKKEYLTDIKFPDCSHAPGPSIRSGDFGEILAADFLEFILGFWVPRARYIDKAVRNESTKGSDIIGFFFQQYTEFSKKDTLAIFESKAQYSGSKAEPKLQEAVNGSAKDITRKAESLNYIKQRFLDTKHEDDADKVERFQNEIDNPYKQLFGAIAHFDSTIYNNSIVSSTTTQQHPQKKVLKLIVICGNDMMNLVHELYRRAADEA